MYNQESAWIRSKSIMHVLQIFISCVLTHPTLSRQGLRRSDSSTAGLSAAARIGCYLLWLAHRRSDCLHCSTHRENPKFGGISPRTLNVVMRGRGLAHNPSWFCGNYKDIRLGSGTWRFEFRYRSRRTMHGAGDRVLWGFPTIYWSLLVAGTSSMNECVPWR